MWWLTLGILPVFAQSAAPDLLTAAELGAGGAIRANPSAPGAALVAPAVLALSPRYEVVVGGRLGSSQVRRLEAAAVDSSTGPITLGALVVRESFERDATTDELPGWLRPKDDTLNPQTHTTLGGGIALSFLNRRLAAGSGFRYQQYTSRFTDVRRDMQLSASLAAKPHQNLFLTVAAEDLLREDDDSFTPVVATAARWEQPQRASLEADLLLHQGEVDAVLSGAQVWVHETLPLRVGYRRNFVVPADVVTAGFSIRSDEASLDYGAQLTLGSLEHIHSLSLRIFL